MAVVEEPGKRGLERLVFLLESIHPGRVGRPPQVRLRLRCDCEKPFGAICLLSFDRHAILLGNGGASLQRSRSRTVRFSKSRGEMAIHSDRLLRKLLASHRT